MKFQLFIIFILLISSCQTEQVAKPRPKQYPRVIWPDAEFVSQKLDYCDFSFDAPSYAKVIKKERVAGEQSLHPCWFDIRMESLNATVFCSYYKIDLQNSYDKLVEDAYTMVSKHNVRANFRDEVAIETLGGSSGIIFKIEGPVATPYQFFISDKVDHFLRGSLYFDQKIDQDSMGLIIQLLQKDLNKLVGSVKWD